MAETRLWSILRDRGLAGRKFVRQFQIGPYIADFVCREAGLIVEVDGGQHAESLTDATRTAHLNAQGYGVLRFWNNDVLENEDGVALAILSIIEGTPSPDLRFAPATLCPMGRGTRGVRATASSHRQALARSIPLPIGENPPAPQRGMPKHNQTWGHGT